MGDYGRAIRWPKENCFVRDVAPIFRRIYMRWRACMILKPFPREEWPQLRTKVCIFINSFNSRVYFIIVL